jgi:hypothetical protein
MEEQRNNSSMGGDKECKGKMCGSGNMCSCGCGCGWARGHRMFRVVLGIVIALLMFWIGVKVGEFKTILGESGYGGGMHRGYPVQVYSGGDVTGGRGGVQMMSGSSTTSAVPVQ